MKKTTSNFQIRLGRKFQKKMLVEKLFPFKSPADCPPNQRSNYMGYRIAKIARGEATTDEIAEILNEIEDRESH